MHSHLTRGQTPIKYIATVYRVHTVTYMSYIYGTAQLYNQTSKCMYSFNEDTMVIYIHTGNISSINPMYGMCVIVAVHHKIIVDSAQWHACECYCISLRIM